MSRFGLGFVGGMNPGNDAFTKALLHMDGANGGTSFADSNLGGSAHSWTPTNATTSTTQKQFGTSSMLSAAGFVTTPDSTDFTLGSGDFTADCWFNVNGNALATGKFLAGQASASSVAGTSSWQLLALTSGIFASVFQSGSTILITGTTNFSATSTWNHVAFVRSGGSILLFVNGVQEASGAIAGSINDSASALSVGRAGDNVNNPWNGYIDEFRLSVGIARWTANFTPPTAPYG